MNSEQLRNRKKLTECALVAPVESMRTWTAKYDAPAHKLRDNVRDRYETIIFNERASSRYGRWILRGRFIGLNAPSGNGSFYPDT